MLYSIRVIVIVSVLGAAMVGFQPAGLRAQTVARVSSGAMMPSLVPDQKILVLPYGRYAWAFSPNQGDIIAYVKSRTNYVFIHRLVGLPGDRVQMNAGVLWINGRAIEKRAMSYFERRDGQASKRIAQFEETLPNGVKVMVLDERPGGDVDDTGVYQVPSGYYFVLGDNRDNSVDSRFPIERGGSGFVPISSLRGWIMGPTKAQELPQVDPTPMCSQAAVGVTAKSASDCITKEQAIYDTLRKSWDSIPVEIRRNCTPEAIIKMSYAFLDVCIKDETERRKQPGWPSLQKFRF